MRSNFRETFCVFREKQIEARQAEKEKERIEMKKAKEKEFEERMAAINAFHEQRKVDLERSIKQKVSPASDNSTHPPRSLLMLS